MPTIIDINVLHKVFDAITFPEFKPVWEALKQKKICAVSGGKHRRDVEAVRKYSGVVLEFNRSGVWLNFNDDSIDKLEQSFAASSEMRSDDPEILALATVAKSRLLVSEDIALHSDFKNAALLSPRGSVYSAANHKHLLARKGNSSVSRGT